MSQFDIYLRETAAEILKAWRAPEFVLPTLAMPVAFYAFFGIAMSGGGGRQARYLLATYGVFAVMGPAIFGFGAGLATERERGWLEIKRAAPASGLLFILAKLTTTILFSAIALMLIYLVAGFAGNVTMSTFEWWRLLFIHLLSALPFALIGLTLGFTFSANGAIAVSNIVFLGLAALGGLWIPIFVLPEVMQGFAKILPTYHLGEIALWAAQAPGERTLPGHLIATTISTVILTLITVWSWRRQQ